MAAVTVGKDNTFRDVAQGCWRMRRLGQGQAEDLGRMKHGSFCIATGIDPVGAMAAE